MKHPEIIILPILMFLDYFLTVLGAIQKEKKYSEHFKAQHYELNPIWQKQIAQKRWFNPRHILLTISISIVFAYLIEFCDMSSFFIQGLFGCLFVSFGMLIGRHLSNIMIFRYLAKRPQDVSGEVTMTHSLLLFTSAYQYLVVLIPIIFIAAFTPSPFVFGGLVGTILMIIVHIGWILRYKKQIKASNKTAIPDL
jgi:hypothetical protein